MTAIRAMLRSALASSVIAGIALAGLIAMHGMDAGTSGSAHAMAMPAVAVEAAPAPVPAMSHDAQAGDAAAAAARDMPESARADSVAGHAGAHASGAMCALAPAPAHVLPQPPTAEVVASAQAAASVVAPIETRAADPPSLTALGVCRR